MNNTEGSRGATLVLKDQVRLLYENSLSANVAVILISALMLIVLKNSLYYPYIVTWFVLMLLTVTARVGLLYWYKYYANHFSPRQWANRYTFLTLLLGIAWSGLSLFYWMSDIYWLQSLLLIVLLGVVAAAVSVLPAIMPAFYAYISPPLAGMVVILLLIGDALSLGLAAATLVYAMLIIATARNSNFHIRRAIEFQYENKDLVEQLSNEVEQREVLIQERTRQLISTNKDLEREISERKRAEDDLLHLAHHDPLTELPNRLLFIDRLEQSISKARRMGEQIAVLFIDLDRFKKINDSLGHTVGDELLRRVAQRFQSSIRNEDTVSRLGGDEFTVIMESLHKPQHATVTAQKLIEAMEEPFVIQGHEFFITTSIGISLYPQDGAIAEELLRNADSAMYRAKDEGRNTFQFYTSDMTEQAFERILMETNLLRAIEKKELVVYYQPQISLKTREIIGLEALIRWNHPELGLVSPARFIPLAEDNGLILPIGEYVLSTACRQLAEWERLGIRPGRVSVNLSGKQLQKKGLLDMISKALEDCSCQPEWLELEVTEGFVMEDPEHSIPVLQSIRDLGIELAIDDFGTGYSSLAYLKRLPITKLKIDQSFVRDIPDDPEDEAIARAILALGYSLNLKVIAEGVENAAQEAFLLNEGCVEAQGFFYAAPLPVEEIDQLLNSEHLIQNEA
jgi:diguanylate cyclase (GGDEF)-like protein